MENKEEEEVITEDNDPDSQIVKDNEEEVTPENDPEKVTLVKDDPVCNESSEGEEVIGEGRSVLKPNPKAKESGKRSWFDLS